MKTTFKVNAKQWQEFDLLARQLFMRRDKFLSQHLWVNPVVTLSNQVLDLNYKVNISMSRTVRNIIRLDSNNYGISRDRLLQQTLYKLIAILKKRQEA